MASQVVLIDFSKVFVPSYHSEDSKLCICTLGAKVSFERQWYQSEASYHSGLSAVNNPVIFEALREIFRSS